MIASGSSIIREDIGRLLESASFKAIGEASDGPEVVRLALELKPDILLLDSDSPSGLQVSGLQVLHLLRPPVRVILLVTTAESSQILEALRSGARGIVLKTSVAPSLLHALRTVMSGEIWMDPDITSDLVNYLRTQQPAADKAREHKFGILSPRELEIIRALHDPLVALEMQIDVLRRQAEADSPIVAELERVQSLLREGVLKLRVLMQQPPDKARENEARQKNLALTPRELEIVSAVAAGYSNKEIAELLKISEDRVKHLLSNIFYKLGVSSRLELALYWQRKKPGGPEGGDGGPEGGDAAGIAVIKPRRPNLNRGSATAKPPQT